MRRERNDHERMTDNAVLLSLWTLGQQRARHESAGDKLKLMKLAFLAAYPLYLDHVKALNLRFYRWKWGPMSDQVYDTLGDLTARGFLLDEEEFIVSHQGLRLAESFTEEVLRLEQNASILRTLEQVADEYAALDRPALLDRVYDLYCYTLASPGRKRQVRAVSQGTDFTRLLEEEEAEEVLDVPPGWQVTLDLTFHPDALRNLQRGIEDAHEGRVYGWEAVGTDV